MAQHFGIVIPYFGSWKVRIFTLFEQNLYLRKKYSVPFQLEIRDTPNDDDGGHLQLFRFQLLDQVAKIKKILTADSRAGQFEPGDAPKNEAAPQRYALNTNIKYLFS